MKYGLLIVDMINDFVKGKLLIPNIDHVISNIKKLIDFSLKNNINIVFCNDAHKKNDKELSIWKQHALENSWGSQIIKELQITKKHIFLKNTYSAFNNKKLNTFLLKNKINKLIIVGLQTHICCQHTIADAFFNKYDTILVSDATASDIQKNKNNSIQYMEKMYATEIYSTNQIISLISKSTK